MSLIEQYRQLLASPATKDLNYELEVRMPAMRYEQFRAVIDRVLAAGGTPVLVKSVDVSYQVAADRRIITRVEFEGEVKVGSTVVEKRELGRHRVENQYSLVLASERILASSLNEAASVTRIKARLAISIASANAEGALVGWRYDFTMLHPCNSLREATDIRYRWLDKITLDNFLTTAASCSHTCKFEAEAEALGPVDSVDPALKLLLFADPGEEILARVRKLLGLVGDTNIKSLANKPVAILRHTYNTIYPAVGWYLAHKADGDRGFLVVSDALAAIITGGRGSPLRELAASPGASEDITLVADGELMDDGRFLIHDLLYDANGSGPAGGSTIKLPFTARLARMQALRPQLEAISDTLVVKEFFQITEDLFLSVERAKGDPGFKTDGHLLIGPDRDYSTTAVYKIKPHNTIDFLAIKCPADTMGRPPYLARPGKTLYLLFCGCTSALASQLRLQPLPFARKLLGASGQYFPQHFVAPDQPNAYLFYAQKDYGERRVFELSRDVKHAEWIMHRIREDREALPNYYGNYLAVAITEWMLSHNPFTLDDLVTPSSDYFRAPRDSFYTRVVKVNSTIKRVYMAELVKPTSVVLDMGSGRGQDISRYCGARHVTFSDKDRPALVELVERRYKAEQHVVKGRGCNYPFSVFVADYASIPDSYVEDLRALAPGPYDTAICNFAIHYFISDLASQSHLVNFLLALGVQTFAFTCFSKQRIDAVLGKTGVWEHKEGDRLKYSIKRAGGAISLILPFSNGAYYEETPVDITGFTRTLKAAKFAVTTTSFVDAPGFSADGLSEADITFVSLYSLSVCTRTAGGARRPRK